MAGETELTIVGNLTADPELRSISTGSSVCNFTIAATPRTFNRQSGQWEDGQALFMRCTAWRELAEHISRSLARACASSPGNTLAGDIPSERRDQPDRVQAHGRRDRPLAAVRDRGRGQASSRPRLPGQ